MPSAGQPGRRSFDPVASLRALADLVNEAIGQLGTQPVPAVAAGPVIARMSVDVSPPPPRSSARDNRTDSRYQDVADSPTAIGQPGGTGPAVEIGASDTDGGGAEGAIDTPHAEVWQLVALAQNGDGEAFGLLYDRYVDTVFRFVYYRVNDRALAEDFTSETFLRALRRISTISYQGRDIGAWFVTIARNIVFDHMKSARHRLEVTTADTIERDDAEPGPEATVLTTLTNERLMAAVDRLGDEQRECVLLRFIQGFSVSETAAVMGKNDGAIKALQHRAIRKLADLVAEELR
jgi:RNA polymerase sigma-70 factor (ECF subfamily)